MSIFGRGALKDLKFTCPKLIFKLPGLANFEATNYLKQSIDIDFAVKKLLCPVLCRLPVPACPADRERLDPEKVIIKH